MTSSAGPSVRGRRRLTCAFVVALSGAMAAQGPEPARGLSRVPAPVGPNGGTEDLYTGSYALLVGVSRYDNEATWPRLESVAGELDSVAAALRASGFDKVDQVSNPTGEQLRWAVDEFNEKYGYKKGHRLVYFFAGHGYTLDDGTRGYFVPRDAPDPRVSEAAFRRIAVSMQQVRTWSQELVARHALFAFDSCFSGTIFRTRESSVPRRLSAITARPVREFLSAGGAGEPVPAKSVFTQAFIRAIRGEADLDSDGYVTGTEIGNFVQREVMAYRTSQTPQFGKIRDPELDEGDVVFAVPGGPAPVVARAPQPPSDPSTPAREAAPVSGADRAGIISALTAFRSAYESMDGEALRQVFPKFANVDTLRQSFADMRAIAVAMNPASAQITIRPDGTALAVALYSVTFTAKTGKMDTFPKRATNANFELRKTASGWLIDRIEYK